MKSTLSVFTAIFTHTEKKTKDFFFLDLYEKRN